MPNSSSGLFTNADRRKIAQIASDILEQKSLISSVSLKMNSLISLVEDVIKSPLASNTPLYASNYQSSNENNANSKHDNSIASIDSVILESIDTNHLNSDQLTIQLI